MRARVVANVLVIAACVVALGLAPAHASKSGKSGAAGEGCGGLGCHGVSPTDGIVPTVDGLPDAYTPGEVYVLNVSVTGGQDPLPTMMAAGGFALHAGDGALAAPPGSDLVQVAEDGNATHTEQGAMERAWSVVWIAPVATAGTVTITLSALAANGNGVPDALDAWNTVRFDVREGEAPEPPPPPTPEDGPPFAQDDTSTPGPGALAVLAALALAVAVTVALALVNARRRG